MGIGIGMVIGLGQTERRIVGARGSIEPPQVGGDCRCDVQPFRSRETVAVVRAAAVNGPPYRRTSCGDWLAGAANARHNHRMKSGDYTYIWQAADWPTWRYDLAVLAQPMAGVSRAQGLLMGRLADVGMALRGQASLQALTEDVIKTSQIEGEQLDVESVRSSVARRLGVDIGALAPVDHHVEGVVDMVLDATANAHTPITRERVFGWHAALFPTGYSGLARNKVGSWRDDASGPMQVVSGPLGRQRVHFEAPPADRLDAETEVFMAWANSTNSTNSATSASGADKIGRAHV